MIRDARTPGVCLCVLSCAIQVRIWEGLLCVHVLYVGDCYISVHSCASHMVVVWCYIHRELLGHCRGDLQGVLTLTVGSVLHGTFRLCRPLSADDWFQWFHKQVFRWQSLQQLERPVSVICSSATWEVSSQIINASVSGAVVLVCGNSGNLICNHNCCHHTYQVVPTAVQLNDCIGTLFRFRPQVQSLWAG